MTSVLYDYTPENLRNCYRQWKAEYETALANYEKKMSKAQQIEVDRLLDDLRHRMDELIIVAAERNIEI
jgi:hypothetical protein